jgi:immune inhibitor A
VNSQRRAARSAAVATVVAALGAAVLSTGIAQADAPSTRVERHDPAPAKTDVEHDLAGPFSKQREAQRQDALRQVISGDKETTRRGASEVVKLGKGKYVELAREKTDKIFTVLVEFGDKVDSTTMYDPDGADGPEPPVKKYGGDPAAAQRDPRAGPRRGQLHVWQADYNRQHFQDLYFGRPGVESLKTYYEKQSSGRYSVDGEVTDWVKVPTTTRPATAAPTASRATATSAATPATTRWSATPPTSGSPTRRPPAAPTRRSRPTWSFDQWDRYDFDGDGNFNEPDGYIDHFQIVHAGGDQADGDPQQGEDAIWSHRWYAYGTDAGAPARPATCSAAPRSATPASGSATTRSSRRTAA